MVAAKALHFVGAGIDDVEKLAAYRDHPVARGAFRLGGADQSEADRYRHVSALVHCKRYITVSAVSWVHGRLRAKTALARCQARVTKPGRETGLASANAVLVI